MIRGILCLILVVLSLFLIAPPTMQLDASLHSPAFGSLDQSSLNRSDPVNGTLSAFNVSYAQFDLYTNKTAVLSYGLNATKPNSRPNTGAPLGNLTWFNNVKTQTGMPVNGTGFSFHSNSTTGISQSINWTITRIPRGVGANTYLRFDWNGTLPKGSAARYQLYNASMSGPFLNFTKIGPLTVPGGPPLNNTGGIPLTCGTTDECFDISKYIGFNVTLAFLFNSNSTGKGISFRVSNVEVVSVASPFPSVSHYMFLNPSKSTEVIHNADLSLAYNATVTYHKPNTTNGNLTHTWGQMVTTFYLPTSYRLNSINLNDTSHPVSFTFPLVNASCTSTGCTNSRFIALNMTINRTFRSTALIQVKSLNAETSVQTTVQGTPTDFWVPGDPLEVQVNNQQGVNVTGTNTVWARDSLGNVQPQFNQTFNVPKRGPLTNSFTALPTSPLGVWNVTSIFKSGYDYGSQSHTFRLEQMQISSGSFSASGSNNALSIQGKLFYASNGTAAGMINGAVFATDTGTPNNNPVTNSNPGPSTTNLYIANLTLINGVFTQSQPPLVMTFGIVNPTAQLFNATLTIDHEWYSGNTHGTTAIFPLMLGDYPFTVSKSYTYEVDISLTNNGVQAKIISLSTLNSKTVTLSVGPAPVVPTRQHTGIFKITISSTVVGGTSGSVASSVESPPYAYVLSGSLVPSRYLASRSFTTDSTGSFTLGAASTPILGAKKLVMFALARDTNGIVLWSKSQDPTSLADNTVLQSSLDPVGQVAEKQTVQATLHITNNSTKITMFLTINLNLQGSGIVDSHTVSIGPGPSQPVTFTFPAPQSPGTYAITISSPQYGSPLASQSLQVSVVQSNLQILLPAIIGLVAAIIVLGFYLLRRQPKIETEEEEKPKSTGPKPTQKPKTGSGTPPRNP